MTGQRRILGGTIAVAAVLALAACGTAPPRTVAEDEIYGPPTMGEWLEIDGVWVVTSADDEGHALLQPPVDSDAEGPRGGDAARWIHVETGETVWERDDVGAVLYRGDEQLVAAVGSGSSRVFAALDLETGETLWSVPESDLGECSGWRLAVYWDPPQTAPEDAETTDDESAPAATPSSTEEPTDEDAPPRLVLRAPDLACKADERALLVELDVTTGEVTEVLRGRGRMTVGWTDGHVAVATWRNEAAILRFYDDVGEQVSSIELVASELVAGTVLTDLASPLELTFEQHHDRPWLRVIWREDGLRHLLNDFLLDPEAGTAVNEPNDDCSPEATDVTFRSQAGTYSYELVELNWCIVQPIDSAEAVVRTNHGEGTSWTAPRVEDGMAWRVTSCRGVVDDLEDGRPLLLGSAPDAQLRAYDLLDGEVIWTLDEGSSGEVLVSTWRDADRVIVLTEDVDGHQLLRTLRLCSGELLEEREVTGADVENAAASSVGWVVTVPLAETTLLTTFHERGTKPEVPDGGRGVGAA